MPIDIKDTGLDLKLEGAQQSVSAEDLIWDESIEDGKYNAELAIVYPWRTVTKDTYVRIRDEEGKYVKDEDDKFVKELSENVTWYFTDLVFKIKGGVYDGFAVKGSISTHPDMIGSAKRFLYAAKLFDVSLKDLKDYTGTDVAVFVKHKEEEWRDKKTGVNRKSNSPYVSYYDRFTDEVEE